MNILLVRLSSLGDVVHTMPVVADILQHHPDARIDWVVEEAYVDLVRMNGGVANVIPFALRRWRKRLLSKATRDEMRHFYRALRGCPYDVVLDTQGLLKSSLVMALARLTPQGKRVGLANGTEGSGYEPVSRLFHTHSVPVDLRTHGVQRGRLVAAAALGYAVDQPANFDLRLPQEWEHAKPVWLPDAPYCAFFHATARAAKQWDAQHWITVGRALAERRLPILLPWGCAAEKQRAEQLAAAIPGARVLPQLSMMEAVLLARRAALAIGVDTGLTHIAAAFCRPTIELYCDSPRWKTEGNWSPNIINLGDQGMPPTLADVLASVERVLGPAVPRVAAPA